MVRASSPAKAILFGEHAVVYGEPALAISLDRRLAMTAEPARSSSVDGGSLDQRKHRYVRWGIEKFWDGGPLSVTTSSSIPSASGLGSSAAICCSLYACLTGLKDARLDHEALARGSFEIEYNVQGRASPTDTSCCTHGNGVLIGSQVMDDLLWSISKGDRTWHVHHIEVPHMQLVVGYTKTPSVTTTMVNKVRNYCERSGFARETISEIGQITMEGVKALRRGDIAEVGSLMDRNQSLLAILGVSSKELKKLLDSVSNITLGAKITGAGGGGSIIALTDDPERVADTIRKRGGVPFKVIVSREGTRMESGILPI